MTLPDFSTNAIFHDQNQFEAEMQTLFLDNWILVGMADQLPAPETWFVHDSWGRSIIVARAKDGTIHGMLNSCTHRGTRICKPDGKGSGKLQCPYHAWTFDCGGKLLGASSRNGFAPFDNKDYSLIPVSIALVGQFIFAHSSPNPSISIEAALGVEKDMLEAVVRPDSGLLHVEQFPIDSNWKFCVSGAIEDYHLPAVHGQSFNKRRKDAAVPELRPGGHSAFSAPRFNGVGKEQIFENDLVFPNSVVIRTRQFIHVTTCTPMSPTLTIHTSRLYDSATKNKKIRHFLFTKFATKSVHKGYVEDKLATEEAQAGTRIAQQMRRGPTHSEEVRVDHFLNEVGRRVNNAPERAIPQLIHIGQEANGQQSASSSQ